MPCLIKQAKEIQSEIDSFCRESNSKVEELKKEIFRVIERNSNLFLITLNGEGFNSNLIFKVTALDKNFHEIAIRENTDPSILKDYSEILIDLKVSLPEKHETLTKTCISALSKRHLDLTGVSDDKN